MSQMAELNFYRLVQQVHDLPQELSDKIYNDVFTADTASRQITLAYKPPIELQVSRATREHFARNFYGGAAPFELYLEDILQRWTTSLPHEHFLLIGTISVPSIGDPPRTSAASLAWSERSVEPVIDVSEYFFGKGSAPCVSVFWEGNLLKVVELGIRRLGRSWWVWQQGDRVRYDFRRTEIDEAWAQYERAE